MVLRFTVHTINGIHSRYGYGQRAREADPEFFSLLEKLRAIQQSGEIGLRLKKTGNQSGTVMVFQKKVDPPVAVDREEVRKLLGSILRPTNLAWSTAQWPLTTKRLLCLPFPC